MNEPAPLVQRLNRAENALKLLVSRVEWFAKQTNQGDADWLNASLVEARTVLQMAGKEAPAPITRDIIRELSQEP